MTSLDGLSRQTLDRRRFLRAMVAAGTTAAGVAALAANPLPTLAAPQPARAAALLSQSEVVIEYWDPDDRPGHKEAKVALAEDFARAYPGLKLNHTLTPWDEMHQKLQTAFATDTLPDVFLTWDGYPLTYYKQGLIQDVTEVANLVGKDDFYAGELAAYTQGDRILALPHTNVVHLLWYRQDWFDGAGLAAPTSWESYLEAARALSDPGKKRYGTLGYGKPGDPAINQNLMAAHGATVFDKDLNPILNSKENVEVLEFLKELQPYYNPDAMTMSQQDARLAFTGEGGAMIVTSDSFSNDVARNAPQLLPSIATIPVPNKGGAPPVWTGMTDGVALVMSHSAKPETKQFLQYFYSKDAYFKYATSTIIGWLPSRKSVREDPAYLEVERIKPFATILKGAFAALERPTITGYEYGPNVLQGFLYGEDVFIKEVQKLFLENLTAQQAADWAQAEAERILKENA